MLTTAPAVRTQKAANPMRVSVGVIAVLMIPGWVCGCGSSFLYRVGMGSVSGPLVNEMLIVRIIAGPWRANSWNGNAVCKFCQAGVAGARKCIQFISNTDLNSREVGSNCQPLEGVFLSCVW